MSPAIVLAIVVATQNADDQATEAMRATAAEAIGGEDGVVIREVEVPSDPEALRIEHNVHSMTVAQVTWLDAPHTRARVRVHVAETNRWTERTLVFATVDSPNERGRALGFAVTSMLPEEVVAASPYRMAAAARAAARGPDGGDGQSTALRLGVLGATGLGGAATGLGGSVAGEFLLKGAMSLRLGFGFREGSVPSLSGNALAGHGALGIAFWPVRPSPEHRVTVGMRVDALVLYHGVSHASPDGAVTRLTKWLPGVDAMAEVALSLAQSLEIVTGVGVEFAIGDTDLFLDSNGENRHVAWRGRVRHSHIFLGI